MLYFSNISLHFYTSGVSPNSMHYLMLANTLLLIPHLSIGSTFLENKQSISLLGIPPEIRSKPKYRLSSKAQSLQGMKGSMQSNRSDSFIRCSCVSMNGVLKTFCSIRSQFIPLIGSFSMCRRLHIGANNKGIVA